MISRIQPNYSFGDFLQIFLPAQSQVKTLEEKFREITGYQSALAFRYGRTGLYYLLRSLGAKNKKVVLPSYTCVVVANAIVESGNIPVFIDCQTDDPICTAEQFLAAIDSETVMIIPTHLFGFAMETKELTLKIKRDYPNIFILQDCAHSFFASDSANEPVYKYGDGIIFGMNISKLVNSVKGGILCLNDKNLSNQIRKLRDQESTPQSVFSSRAYVFLCFFAFTYFGYKVTRFLLKNTRYLDSEVKYYTEGQNVLPEDYKYQMTDFEASMGLRSLKKFEKRIQNRRTIANEYIHALKNQGMGYMLPKSSENPGNTWSHFPILLPAHVDRNAVIETLESTTHCEIGKIVDYSVGNLKGFSGKGNIFPNAIMFAERVINLPLSLNECLLAPKISPAATVEALKKALK